MERRATRLAGWLNRTQWEGQDDYGIHELTAGVALVAGFAFFALLPRVTLWTSLPLYALLAAGAWYGGVLETRQLRALGRRRARGMLDLPITWVTLALALALSGLALALAHSAGWADVVGWSDGPLLLTLTSGLANVSQGVRLSIRRRQVLGAVLCGVAVLLPGAALLRTHLFVSTAVLTGGAHVLSGLAGQAALRRRLRRDGIPGTLRGGRIY